MISGEFAAFIVLAICVISGAVLMISLTKVVHMVVALAFTFIGLAGVYVILSAEFVAIVQILIYAGAITILMIFGIMMTKHNSEEVEPHRPWHNTLLIVGSLGLFGILFFVIRETTFPETESLKVEAQSTLAIGKLLYNDHVLPFELVSILLTVAFIGAIVMAKREEG